ncbi:MAG TPA: triose-phosphate isomerase [Rhizomicrobium sp.]
MRPLIAGNWKMNGLGGSLAEIASIGRWIANNRPAADILVCPPFTLIARAAAVAPDHLRIGGQDCHAEPSGAFTGDVSAEMLNDAGAVAVIIGHSERRHFHGETDEIVAAKARAAWRAGLLAIVCVGEKEDQHDSGQARNVVRAQIEASLPQGANPANTALAYEPVWAIGSGRTPSADEIVSMHGSIRAQLEERLGAGGALLRILYGGSVKPANAPTVLSQANVGGVLVGGASLRAEEFAGIIRAAADASSHDSRFAV